MLRLLDRRGADKDRLPAISGFRDRLHDSGELLALRPVDLVILVDTADGEIGRDVDDLEPVDIHELAGFGHCRTGHAGELLVETEVVLERDRRQRLVLRLDLDLLFGFERLMQAFRITAAGHHAAGEFVDDDDLPAFDDVILIALEQLVGLQRLRQVMDDRDVVDVVKRALQEARCFERALHLFVAGFRERNLTLLFVEFEVFGRDDLHHLVDLLIQLGPIFQWAGDDQGRPCFVDEDRVHFVDDCVRVRTLHHLGVVHLHIIAQIIEAEFVVRTVGHVAGVSDLAELVAHVVDDAADRQTEEAIDLAHPVGVALGQVVVDGDDVDALAGEGVEVGRQRGDERLAFARLHFGDVALMQDHAADELDVEVALAKRALCRFTDGRERGNEQIIERGAVVQLLTELSVRARSSSLGQALAARVRAH